MSVFDTVANLLNVLTPWVSVLVGTGLLTKYAPFMKWLPNELIKPLNALIIFLGALGGAVTPAHAGIFNDIIGQVGIFGKLGLSIVVSSMASWTYEKWLRDPMTKLGFQKV